MPVKPIELVGAETHGSAGEQGMAQRLWFCCAVENRAFEKRVEIHWAGRDGQWRILLAHHVGVVGATERWEADAVVPGPGLPGALQCAVRLVAAGGEWWDNNGGANFQVPIDGAYVGRGEVLTLDPAATVPADATEVRVRVATVDSARAVHVRWTADEWGTSATAACCPEPRLPGPLTGARVWATTLPIGAAPAIEYAVVADLETGEPRWDSHGGQNYRVRRTGLKILTLNLHCFEEEEWDTKFWTIARVIDAHDVDVVCFQEVAEPWNGGHGDATANAARIIRSRLRRRYHLTADWSHLGFGRYREGSAILSRHRVNVRDSAYVSTSTDPYNIHARKVVMAEVEVPGVGPVNIFSTHLSWWSDGFEQQFRALRRWASEQHREGIAATLLCGDFNSEPSSAGYRLATADGEYEDQFLKAHLQAGRNGDVAAGTDRRIDYIFLRRGSVLTAAASKVLFTASDYGQVSDHPGYFAEFTLRP